MRDWDSRDWDSRDWNRRDWDSYDWDSYDAYLFDIDGTLLNCTDAVHYFAFCETLTQVAGRPLNLDGVTTHGNTDVGILRDAFGLNRIEDSAWRHKLVGIRAGMAAFVESNKGDLRAETLPGVMEILEHLRGRGAVIGLATGNLEAIGWLKLEHCGLRSYFDFGGFSDQFEYRSDVFRSAAALARERAGESAAICVVGDTPADVQAARENGLDVIAVATGVYSVDQLEAEGPTVCIGSFEELMARRLANPIRAKD